MNDTPQPATDEKIKKIAELLNEHGMGPSYFFASEDIEGLFSRIRADAATIERLRISRDKAEDVSQQNAADANRAAVELAALRKQVLAALRAAKNHYDVSMGRKIPGFSPQDVGDALYSALSAPHVAELLKEKETHENG